VFFRPNPVPQTKGASSAAEAPFLVEILFNEKAVHIPAPTPQFPYYRWDVVRHYYIEKLKRLGVDPAGDMYQYLLHLR
jgi:hypothetical protein